MRAQFRVAHPSWPIQVLATCPPSLARAAVALPLVDSPAPPTVGSSVSVVFRPRDLDVADGRVDPAGEPRRLLLGAEGWGAEICVLSETNLELSYHLAGGEPALPLLDAGVCAALGLGGVAALHAALLRYRGRHVLALGRRGSGKSTLTAAAVLAGGLVGSDDTSCVFVGSAGRVNAVGVAADVFLRPGSFLGFGERIGGRKVSWPDGERFAVDVGEAGRLTDAVVPDELWSLPGMRGDPVSTKAPLGRGAALAALVDASSAPFLTAAAGPIRTRVLGVLRSLAEGVPAFEIRTAVDLLERPAVALDRLLGFEAAG